ncbi:chorismate--pyruvate lyase family protein [Aeromonas cavernicola]|uniref:Probable chorismate pyruvate-lyase n=1 Tax=Aeromonas cavernicola TaxID=1006623 RepID=A0A2H9U6T2_9GAMM|nr:chorismate lyase [Aeromonas cavernicola]PJG59699.1 chorismate lyase [Aeromonas cavernicola]
MKSEPTAPLIPISEWLSPECCELPTSLRPWLLERGSMTQRLRRYNRHFSVEWLGNAPVQLSPDEQRWVASPEPTGYCRTVTLHGDAGPVVLGWTLFSHAALHGCGLAELGHQPLGERVFDGEPVRRDQLQLARFALATGASGEVIQLWGRRSRLFLGQWPLLVHELFLPSLIINKELE